jgi:CBS domain-containing protein
MRISDLMTPAPITVAADASVATAAMTMRDHDLGSLPVVDNDQLVGFITDRDIVVRCVASDNDCSSTPIKEIMSADVFCCRDEHTPEEAMECMAIQQVQRLPVLDAKDRLVGIVSIGKLAESCGEPTAVCATIKAVRRPVAVS